MALGGWAWVWPPPVPGFAAGAVLVLGIVAVWEWGSLHGGWRVRLGRLWPGGVEA
jgi:hypothetical protein